MASGSGTKLLKILADELKTSSDEHGQYAARQMAALVDAGISAPTVVAFDSFRAFANQSTNVPVQPVGSLRTDRAGELISREFTELLDSEGVDHITSPPYVHQLNGVAERSIRSTFSLVRSYLVASQLSPAFWTFAAEMAIDVLNRTTVPPQAPNEKSSYEMLTCQPSKVLNVMPFGCRAFAVKPREQYSKTILSILEPGLARIWDVILPARPASESMCPPSAGSSPPPMCTSCGAHLSSSPQRSAN